MGLLAVGRVKVSSYCWICLGCVIQMRLHPPGLRHISWDFPKTTQEVRWPAQGAAVGNAQSEEQPGLSWSPHRCAAAWPAQTRPGPWASAEGGGPAHFPRLREAQPSLLKGTGPQSDWANAWLCLGPKQSPQLASAGGLGPELGTPPDLPLACQDSQQPHPARGSPTNTPSVGGDVSSSEGCAPIQETAASCWPGPAQVWRCHPRLLVG